MVSNATQRRTRSMSHNHADVGLQLDEDNAFYRVEAHYGVPKKYCFWPKRARVLLVLLVLSNSKNKTKNRKKLKSF